MGEQRKECLNPSGEGVAEAGKKGFLEEVILELYLEG